MTARPPAHPPLVLITGASSGIGQALAEHYARAGCRLALVVRDPVRVQPWLAALGLLGLPEGHARLYLADVRDQAALIAAGRDCLAQQGLPDVVIASAGISVGMDTAEVADLAVMADTLAINVTGLAATFQPFVAPMREAGRGTLVGIASVAAIRGLPGHGAYCASKAAVVAYCESLRGELRSSGVRVVTVLPGFIDTPMTRGNPYPMPFLMPVEDFARAAARAIAQGRRRVVLPWQMALVARLLMVLPGAWFDRLMAKRGRKPRRASAG
ncbi:MAG: hypothetical protein RL722_1540 [Pseudomonadota bacterium]|jgi:short-subunit dehydrogenase